MNISLLQKLGCPWKLFNPIICFHELLTGRSHLNVLLDLKQGSFIKGHVGATKRYCFKQTKTNFNPSSHQYLKTNFQMFYKFLVIKMLEINKKLTKFRYLIDNSEINLFWPILLIENTRKCYYISHCLPAFGKIMQLIFM